MSFGSAVVLSDLSDYIAPSQKCVNPIFTKTEKKSDADGSKSKESIRIRVDEEEEESGGNKTKGFSSIRETVMETAQITLNDCLACSGCVTSAETVLVERQSSKTFRAGLGETKLLVVSISEEARAAIASRFGVSSFDVHWRLRSYFRRLHKRVLVIDAGMATDLALVEIRQEFARRWRRAEAKRKKVWARPTPSIAVSATKERVISESAAADELFDNATTAAMGAAMIEASMPAAKKARRSTDGQSPLLPLIVSSCPGWVCYAEKRFPEIIPYMSAVKSPQQILGMFVKTKVRDLLKEPSLRPTDIHHVSIMACFDKKLEASRLDFWHDEDDWGKGASSREVDMTLTSKEVVVMIEDEDKLHFVKDLSAAPPADVRSLEWTLSNFSPDHRASYGGAVAHMSSSGGYTESVFRWASSELLHVNTRGNEDPSKNTPYVRPRRCNNDDFREIRVESCAEDGTKRSLTFAIVYGFRHIQKIVRQIRSGRCKYDFVEIMACPGGCLNGGGQTKPEGFTSVDAKDSLRDTMRAFARGRPDTLWRDPSESPFVHFARREWLGEIGSDGRVDALHTRYHAVPEMPKNPLAIKW